MNDDEIKELLNSADAAAGPVSYGSISAAGIRARARGRRIRLFAFPLTAAAVVFLGVGVHLLHRPAPESATNDADRIVALEEQIKQLQAQSAETQRLVREVLAAEHQKSRIEALEAELASMRDPAEEMRQQTNEAAYRLLYQADRFYQELNQRQSAIETYEQVIRVFPDSPWAEEARDRLAEIRTHRANRT